MRLDQIIAEADAVIEKRAGKAPVEPAVMPVNDDETVKLASFLENFEEPAKPQVEAPFQLTLIEKVASAIAVVEALNHFEEFHKIASFVEKAREAGHTEEGIQMFLEKKAIKIPSSVALPALAAVAAGVGGHLHGKKKGYEKAMGDVQSAFEQANQANG